MLAKHQQLPLSTLSEGPTPPPAILCKSIVLKCVSSFPKGSAPGPSGLHPSHLREATRCPSPDQANQFMSLLTTFVNLLAAGRTPSDVTPYLCGATLLTSKKKSGGHCPIAVGEVLQRLVSKCLSSHSRAAINSLLIPLQLGVGLRGGCEVIVHAMSKLTTSLPDDRSWTLMLDFTNAFNSISQQAMFEGLRNIFPAYLLGWNRAILANCYIIWAVTQSAVVVECSKGISSARLGLR